MKIDQKEMDRIHRAIDGPMTGRILDWIAEVDDDRPFHRRDIIQDFHLFFKGEPKFQALTYQQLNRALKILCIGGYIEPVPHMSFGWYRPVNKKVEEMDPWNVQGQDADIWLPFELAEKAKVFNGDIILFAGSPNVGKTALTLNVAKENGLKGWDVRYFNSEMSEIELSERLKMFSGSSSSWENVKFYSRAENFQDVVFPGSNTINIIDFLQLHTDFYAIGATLFEIHKRLHGSVCIINMQKNPGSDTALGGFRTLELPRLAVAVDFQKAKIVKCKAWRNKDRNPNSAECSFKLRHGHDFIPANGIGFKWLAVKEKEK